MTDRRERGLAGAACYVPAVQDTLRAESGTERAEWSGRSLHLDLFSGIGGFALAAQWTGFRTVAFAEIETFPSSVLARHWPGVPNLGDVTKLCRRVYDCEPETEYGEVWCPRCNAEFGECACIGTDQFLDEIGRPELITGGVPCQPASLIGKRGGTDDERWLWPDTIRIMGELRPRFGLFENPAAILSLESGRAFNGILSGMAALGYDVLWECVSAGAVGAGHRRERVWILAADPDCSGLEGYTGNGEVSRRSRQERHAPAKDLRARRIASERWYSESGIEPVVNGLPGRVARQQLTAIGNALVPQVPRVLLDAVSRVRLGGEGGVLVGDDASPAEKEHNVGTETRREPSTAKGDSK